MCGWNVSLSSSRLNNQSKTLLIFIELRLRDVKILPSFDVWAAAMTLIVMVDNSQEKGGLYKVVQFVDPETLELKEEDQIPMESFEPVWERISDCGLVEPILDVFKSTLTAVETRAMANDVVSYLIRMDIEGRKPGSAKGSGKAGDTGGKPEIGGRS